MWVRTIHVHIIHAWSILVDELSQVFGASRDAGTAFANGLFAQLCIATKTIAPADSIARAKPRGLERPDGLARQFRAPTRCRSVLGRPIRVRAANFKRPSETEQPIRAPQRSRLGCSGSSCASSKPSGCAARVANSSALTSPGGTQQNLSRF